MTSEKALQDLMIAALEGDSSACNSLLQSLSTPLRSYFRTRLIRFGQNQIDSEDLVQEALIAIFTKRHTFDIKLPLMPWVYAIAKYKFIDHLRARKIGADVDLDLTQELEAKDDYVSIESALDLNRLLKKLPGKMRNAIRMIKIEGRSIAEASHISGMSQSSLKVNVHRGLKVLSATVHEGGINENK